MRIYKSLLINMILRFTYYLVAILNNNNNTCIPCYAHALFNLTCLTNNNLSVQKIKTNLAFYQPQKKKN